MEPENPNPTRTPPPLPGHKEPFSSKAGKLSLATFLCVFGLVAVKNASLSLSPQVALLGFAIAMLLLAAGVVLGLISLIGLRQHGRPAYGIIGMVLNGLLIVIGVTNFYLERIRALENQRRVQTTVTNLGQEIKASFDPTNGLNTSLKPISRFKESLESASAESQGAQKLYFQAAAAYAAKMQAAMTEFTKAVEVLKEAKVFEAHRVEDKDALFARRQMVEKFLAANERFASFVTRTEGVFSNELINAGVDGAAAPKIIAGFNAGQARVKPLVLKIRSLDSEIGHASLEMIDLLATNWGAWKVDQASGKPVSDDAEFRTDYNRLLQRITDAQKEEIATQAKVVNLK